VQDEAAVEATDTQAAAESDRKHSLAVTTSSAAGMNTITSIPTVSTCTLPRDPSRDNPATISLQRGVVWATLGGQALTMDISRPKTFVAGEMPLVVVIHGGAWQGGTTSQMTTFINTLAGLGYAAVAIDYRVKKSTNSNYFPVPISDTRCAVRWLKKNAATYGWNPNKIIAAGMSAGGHLASMLGAAPDATGLDDGTCSITDQSPSVGAVVDMFGPSDMNLETDKAKVITAADLANPAKMALYSPVSHIKAGTVPFFVAHGTVDTSVTPKHSELLKAQLDLYGVVNNYIKVEGVGHGFPLVLDSVTGARVNPNPVTPSTCTWLAAAKNLTK
jgi:acetyl esterase/lipase